MFAIERSLEDRGWWAKTRGEDKEEDKQNWKDSAELTGLKKRKKKKKGTSNAMQSYLFRFSIQ